MLHIELPMSEAAARDSYNRGLRDLESEAPAHRTVGFDFLLPYSVVAARAKRVTSRPFQYPSYDALTKSEKTGVRIVCMALEAKDGAQFKAWFRARWLLPLLEQASNLFEATRRPDRMIDKEVLRWDRGKPESREIWTTADAADALPAEIKGIVVPAFILVSVCELAGVTSEPQRPEPEGVSGSGRDFLRQLAALRDPEVWHLIVDGFNYDQGDTRRAIDWIVDQRECDAATAALAFLRLCGRDYVGQQIPDLNRPSDPPDAATIIAKICLRSESEWFIRADLSLSCAGEDDDQRALLATLLEREGGNTPGRIPVPRRLLSHLYDGRPPDTPYRVEPDCTIWRL